MRIINKDIIEIEYSLLGDPTWHSTSTIATNKRMFIYSETDLSQEQIRQLQSAAAIGGHEVQFRSKAYVDGRTMLEKPLAFITHDSRDKDKVARPIAIALQKMLCPVWYDEFSLKVGDHLRESIERGLKECKKCGHSFLSPNFFSNTGWSRLSSIPSSREKYSKVQGLSFPFGMESRRTKFTITVPAC